MSRRAVAAAAIVLAAVALYASTTDDYFLQDDFGVVSLFARRSLAYFPRWFVMPWTEDIWGYVPDELRPFPAASYVVASWFGPSSPGPNHVINIALHAFNGVLVMWIAEAAAGLSVLPAAASGVLFVLLPIQAESVAWVTGRVDSLPTCFYFASFLLYVRSVRPLSPGRFGVPWKPDAAGVNTPDAGRRRYDRWSVVLFFVALFTKQNTITLGPALVLFDLVVERRRVEVSWRWLRPYVPYMVLTAAFLLLRWVVFHEVARENTLSAQRVQEFVSDSSRHLVRLVFGGAGIRSWSARDTGIIAVAIVAVVAIGRRFGRPGARALWRPALYFGPIWLALGIAPILVSGYYSPRHMYLASLGWAVTLGIAVELLWRVEPSRYARLGAVSAAAGLAAAYALNLHAIVGEWSRAAAISETATRQIEREAALNPEGTLIIAGVPRSSWAFAIPHSVRPPFTATDVTARTFVISDTFDHCCDAVDWNEYTRNALRAWHDRPVRAPVVALYWNPRTGRMSRVSDRDDPQLQTVASLLLQITSREALDSAIRRLMNDYVALR